MLLPPTARDWAERIVASRQTVGPFRSPDDLRRVSGIGKKVFANIRPYLRVTPNGSNAAGP